MLIVCLCYTRSRGVLVLRACSWCAFGVRRGVFVFVMCVGSVLVLVVCFWCVCGALEVHSCSWCASSVLVPVVCSRCVFSRCVFVLVVCVLARGVRILLCCTCVHLESVCDGIYIVYVYES